MKKSTAIWLIIAASLVLVGCIVLCGVMMAVKWDFTKLSTIKYETNSYEINEDYSNISIVTDTADILFVASKDSESSIECYEQNNLKHSVSVKDGALVIELADTRKWYEHVGINFDAPRITVYIPQGAYGALSVDSDTGDVEIPEDFSFESIDISESTGNVKNYASASGTIKIKTSTGHIRLEGISAGELDLSASTGNVTVSEATCEGDVKVKVTTGKTKLTDVKCRSVLSRGSTGDITAKNVIASEKFSVERSTGDVRFDRSDAAEIFVKTDTGDVEGSLLTDKVFLVETDTGDIDVPDSVTGGRCEITTDTGDIEITVN